MATRIKRVVPQEDEISAEDIDEMRAELSALAEQVEAQTDQPNVILQGLYAELGIEEELDDARVYVSKINYDGMNHEGRVWDGDAEACNMQTIGKRFGSGQYRVKVYVKHPVTRKPVLKTSKEIGVILDAEDEARLKAPIAPPAQSGGLTMADVQVMIQQGIGSILPTIQQAIQPPQNPLGMMKELAEVMRTLQPPPAPAQTGGLSQMKDMIEIVHLMREGNEAPIGPGAGTMDVLMKLAEKFGPALASVVQQQAAQQAPAQQPVPQVTMPALQNNPAPAVQPTPTEDEAMKAQEMQLRMGIGFLVSMAEAKAAPEPYADVILDNVGDEMVNNWLALPEGPLPTLIKIDPRVEQHRAWFERVVAELRVAMTPETDEPYVQSESEHKHEVKS